MDQLRALRPDVASFGYAVILSINATSIWGGIFPYLPACCQTDVATIAYYCIQILAFAVTFCGAMALIWKRPAASGRSSVMAFALPLCLGPLMLVGAMYVEDAARLLIVGASLLVGFGLAGFMMCWQRVFAAMNAERGNLTLIKGTGYSALLYLAICLVPAALTAYLIPLVLVPLAGLCLWLANRSVSLDQPMFEDVPREHRTVYRNALRASISPALSVGALGFCAGAIRFIAITHQELISAINIFSMVVLLLIMLGFFGRWQRRTLRIGLPTVFRTLFPVAAVCLMVLPFAGNSFVTIGFGISNACFMLACVFMMMHCGQMSRDSGINPVFIYAFYGAIAYLPQTAGYGAGYLSGIEFTWGPEPFSLVALASLFVLLMVSLFGYRQTLGATDALEFLALGLAKEPGALRAEATASGNSVGAGFRPPATIDNTRGRAEARPYEDAAAPSEAFASAESPTVDAGNEAAADAARDALALRCRRVSEVFGLSSRETEVMELIARGYSGPAIAEMLFISENTMRTHNKRIYAKLNIHKKQDMIDLINNFENA
ncbi:helix-turn-helix transcriptional regulator [Adlercreutzia sp. R21]|uniref:helix-turn-helix transcriptional regulator n=1 Tax=Adlercreutzia wanghongyangiae TaxID=3111451 RepID=UPI002DBA6830|nr:helix-turn-helix transcriptional regulator [Adlercreutzia sp. R21]MEC4183616.1 helix-turn-helix transcriptional regulator [Adlercreutzia sp. R21]